jgi:hypothetical protein
MPTLWKSLRDFGNGLKRWAGARRSITFSLRASFGNRLLQASEVNPHRVATSDRRGGPEGLPVPRSTPPGNHVRIGSETKRCRRSGRGTDATGNPDPACDGETVLMRISWSLENTEPPGESPIKAAVLAVGYADGLPHRLSNKGKVIAGGRFAPIVGTVSMDVTPLTSPNPRS